MSDFDPTMSFGAPNYNDLFQSQPIATPPQDMQLAPNVPVTLPPNGNAVDDMKRIMGALDGGHISAPPQQGAMVGGSAPVNPIDDMKRIMGALSGQPASISSASHETTNAPRVEPINPITDMARLIAAMNANTGIEDASSPREEPQRVSTPTQLPTNDVAAMKQVMAMFSDQSVASIADRAQVDGAFREALNTTTTDNGVHIGAWTITIKEDAAGLKSYDVLNTTTGEAIASDLTLYDAAKGITSALNEGYAINTPRIRRILNAEGAYARARQNAAEFRQRISLAESRGDRTKQAVAEDRFTEALAKAKEARALLAKMV